MENFFTIFNGPTLLVYAFVIGACIGSFINVVNYRVPLIMMNEWRDDSIEYLESLGFKIKGDKKDSGIKSISGRSRCTSCKTPIKSFYNIPIFGWIFLKGKSSCCKETISKKYPLTELAFGIVFSTIFYYFPNIQGIMLAYVFTVLFSISWIDIENKVIPDAHLFFLSLPAIFFSDAIGNDLSNGIKVAIAAYLAIYILNEASKLILKKEGIGMGDAKMFAVCSLFLGPEHIGYLFLSSPILLILLNVIARNKLKNEQIPFGPSISICFFYMLLLIMA